MFRCVAKPWFTRLAVLALLLAPVTALSAQGGGTLRGRVTEAATDRPIANASVQVVGTTVGGVTNSAGEYTIANVPPGPQRIRVRRIGFGSSEQTVNVGAGASATANFAMHSVAIDLDAVVVTGTAGEQEKRTIGNAITQLNVADLAERTTIQNVTEAMQSKSPGVTILPGSGVTGTASEIRIRGASSLAGYRPVVYIDGIRYSNEDLGNFSPTGSGLAGQAQSSQVTSALDLINPNDIESIEIIKGPAAATLYGADAANGVIQILTKKGTRGQQQPLRWTVKVDQGRTDWHLATPVNYTLCDSARQAQASVYPGCVNQMDTNGELVLDAAGNPIPVSQGTLLTDEPMRRDPNALRTGTINRLSLSLRGGGDRYTFFVSGDRDREEGVYLNNFNNRRSGRANFTVNPSQRADLTVNLGYIQSHFRLPYQDESANALLLSAARGRPGAVSNVGYGWRTINPLQSNRYENSTKAERFTIGSTLNYRPWTWFTNRVTAGLDYTTSLAELTAEPGSVEAIGGFVAQRIPRVHVYSLDYVGNVVRDLTSALRSTTSFGSQVISNRRETLAATGSGLGAADVTLIGSAALTSGSNDFSEFNSVGYYVQEQLGWNNRMFLTGALRADDHSSFGKDFDIIVYPKLMFSWVLSEEPRFGGIMNALRGEEFRLRTAWGRAGRAPSPFSAIQTYTVDRVILGTSTANALRTGAYGNPGLKPEKGEEIELGFDASFFGRRVGTEFTFYNKTTTDMLVAYGIAGSSGFGGAIFTNLGEVNNRGVELGLNLQPLRLSRLTWDSRLTMSSNRNRLITFGDPFNPNKYREPILGQAYGAVQEHRVGYPLGGYWAQFPLRNEDGTPVLNAAGTVQLDTSVYIGPSAPTREIGWSNTFTLFRNFRLYSLFDHKAGHYLFNLKERNRCQTANNNCQRVNDPNAAVADVRVWQQVPAVFIEKADFIKLRELSLTYNVPSTVVSRMGAGSLAFTLSGRNLGLWTDYSGLDPEVNTYGGRNFARVDAYASPMMRRITFTATVGY